MTRLASGGFAEFGRRRARLLRRLRGALPAVHYFHQADDPYSHLAVQKLAQLRECYPVTFEVHLTSRPAPEYLGSSGQFDAWALSDAESIAAAYGVRFPAAARLPEADTLAAANDALAGALETGAFATRAVEIGDALWSGEQLRSGNAQRVNQAVEAGNRLRRRLGHFQGGMFYFDGEWFWGLDRLHLLEARLRTEGLASPGAAVCVPEPVPRDTTELDCSGVHLEYFPSLRSPYTAVGHRRVLDLIDRSGVSVHLRPVMPMLMRGVTAPRAKQRHIITDAGREGRAHGAPLGRIVDPFGEPVKRAFALFPGAVALEREMAFVTEYLQAAWMDGVDITADKGLEAVARRAGLSWPALRAASRDADWESLLDENLSGMLGAGLWGVPSFRVSGGSAPSAAWWGQDRIWRVENEIAARSADPGDR